MKAKRIKNVVILFIAIYGLAIGVFLFNNTNMKRHIVIETRRSYGVVSINNTRYKTPYQIQQVQIATNCDNALDFLFLGTESQQESYLGAVAKFLLVVTAIVLLWQLDVNKPFQIKYLKFAGSIFLLYVVVIAAAWARNIYTQHWVSLHLPGSGYGYKESSTGIGLYLTIIVFAALLNLYYRAVANNEELELTI